MAMCWANSVSPSNKEKSIRMGDAMKNSPDLKTVIIIVLLIILAGLIFDPSSPLPPNCHRTPSVYIGGGEIECD